MFYIVTGAGGPESRVLPNTKYCKSNTAHMRNYLEHVHANTSKFEVYTCGEGREEINVLHLPHCLGTYAGARGPCCRCESAMLFYAAMHKAHAVHEHKFPEWMIFADDDYFMRLELLEATLETTVTPHDKEYALASSVFMSKLHREYNGTNTGTLKPFNGLHLAGQKCVSPCIFKLPVRTILRVIRIHKCSIDLNFNWPLLFYSGWVGGASLSVRSGSMKLN